jgi:glycosyltransferase involved in cell wall biosynthesis
MDKSETSKLRIGFLSAKNYFDRHAFSGTLYSMYESLSKQAQVIHLGRPHVPSRARDVLQKLQNYRAQRRDHNAAPDPILAKFARVAEKQLAGTQVDAVFAPVASAELRLVTPKEPVLYASDATFKVLRETYEFEMEPQQIAQAETAERSAIQIARGIVYSSGWAAQSAIDDYGADKDKIRVIPYGANLDDIPDKSQIFHKCGRQPWKLVFIGFYWHRKGGDIALKAFDVLRRRGIDAELIIIGAPPPESVDGRTIRIIPFLDKRRSRDRAALREILLSSHVMLFPTRADCSPIALCEAAAFGIPVVAADVGGIKSIVTPQTGRVIHATSAAENYAAAVLDVIGNAHRYREYIRSARQRFDEVLNWDKWARSVVEFCRELL